MAIPVYIIAGFLGVGKTTLINHIVKTYSNSAGLFVINDELGTAPIDDEFFEHQCGWITNLRSGYLPEASLRELIGTLRYAAFDCNPDSILIELTGLAYPKTVVRIVKSPFFEGLLSLGGVVTVVNPEDVLDHSETVIDEQINAADTVVINKEDLVIDQEMLQRAHKRVASMTRQSCRILRSHYARVDACALLTSLSSAPFLEVRTPQCFMMNAILGYAIMNFFSHKSLSCQRLTTLLARHTRDILRAKGVLKTDLGDKVIQCVRGEVSMLQTVRNFDQSKLVIITRVNRQDAIQDDFSSLFL
jgi:cobalamin biosynthesis protein CobW